MSNYADIQLLTLNKPPHRKRGVYAYRQRQIRQRRLAILGVGLLLVLAVSALAAWGLFQTTKPLFSKRDVDTRPITALLKKDLALFPAAASPIYYNTFGYSPVPQTAITPAEAGSRLFPLLPSHEDTKLKERLQNLFAAFPQHFKPHLYFYNLQDGTYAEINGYSPVSAASVIKLPILLHYLLELDHHTIQPNSRLLYADFHRAGGAGGLQYQPTGVVFDANDVAGQMIRVSDNTCTNIMISALGGTDAVNRRLRQLGLVQTRIRNWLPDLAGTNTISAYEMATILYNLDHGPLLSRPSRQNGLDILESTHNRRLLVWQLPREAKVAHKTGDIGTALGDSGIVYLPDGRRYIISVQMERPFNDYTARDMIQQASRLIYDHVAEQPSPGTLATRI